MNALIITIVMTITITIKGIIVIMMSVVPNCLILAICLVVPVSLLSTFLLSFASVAGKTTTVHLLSAKLIVCNWSFSKENLLLQSSSYFKNLSLKTSYQSCPSVIIITIKFYIFCKQNNNCIIYS